MGGSISVHSGLQITDGNFRRENPLNPFLLVVLVVALVERWTRDRKVAGSIPGRGAANSTRSTQSSIPPG